MSSVTENQGPTQHPMFIFGVLSVATIAILAALLWASQEPTGTTVGAPAAPENTEMSTIDERSTDTLQVPVVETSGSFVSPEDVDPLTTPVSGTEAGETQADIQTSSELRTDLVVDPDRGAKGGPDPDGGAAPFYPTPSGPEGRDGDPFTTN